MEPTSYIPDIPFHTSERHAGQERERKARKAFCKKNSLKISKTERSRLNQILRQGRL